MNRLHPISWLTLAALAAIASPGLSEPLPLNAALAAPSRAVNFSIYLPLRNTAELERVLEAQQTPGGPEYQRWLSPTAFAAKFGPTPQSIGRVRAALKAGGLTIADAHSGALRVSGTVGQVNTMFGARLRTVAAAGGGERIATSSTLVLPTALQQEGARIVGLGNLPQRHPMSTKILAKTVPANRYGVAGPYWFTDLKQAYDYPSYESTLANGKRLDGTGVHAAVLMADLIFPGDVAAAFGHEKFTVVSGNAPPTVDTVLIDGGGVYDGYGSFEASLDVQQITGGAPGAKVTLFSIPDLSDVHILDGYTAIVESNLYDVVNSSFGGCELGYTASYNNGVDYTYVLQIEHEVFMQGNAQGITFVASSGDEGGLECPAVNYLYGKKAKFVKSVGVPAADPAVTAVGGGNLVTASDGSLGSSYVRESAFGDPRGPYDPYGFGTNVTGGYWGAGGGISTIFKQPGYQAGTKTGSRLFRTIPDVGMQVGGLGFSGAGCNALTCSADDSSVLTAYGIGLGGGYYYTIGTSVSSPEFVSALALFIQKNGVRRGNVNSFLYSQGVTQTGAGGVNAPASAQFYHRNIPGFDGVYTDAKPSQDYNYINGNGTPDVRKLFGMTAYSPAGTPKSPSNP